MTVAQLAQSVPGSFVITHLMNDQHGTPPRTVASGQLVSMFPPTAEVTRLDSQEWGIYGPDGYVVLRKPNLGFSMAQYTY